MSDELGHAYMALRQIAGVLLLVSGDYSPGTNGGTFDADAETVNAAVEAALSVAEQAMGRISSPAPTPV